MKKSDEFIIKYMVDLCEDIYYLKDEFGDSYDDLLSESISISSIHGIC